MKLKLMVVAMLGLSLVTFGCAGLGPEGTPLKFAPQKYESGKYVSKVDNFQIITDASMTMGNSGGVNFQSAKNFVTAVNQSLPADLSVNSGLRSFGHSDMQSKNKTDLVYGMTQYSQSGLQGGVDSLKYAGGNSPLATALDAATADLKGAGAKSTVLVVSDGLQMADAPVAATNLKAELGPEACIYTVWIGDNPEGQKLLQKVAEAGGCGTASNGAELTSSAALGALVKNAFLADKPAPPPPPPAPKPVPPPVVVAKEVVTFNLLFGFDKAQITDEMIPILEQAKIILEEDPATKFTVSGHTDSTGPEAYNQGLSERRAAAVRDWLVNNGVDADRLDVVGYGETRPKYDNSTKEGRKLNRRVELESK